MMKLLVLVALFTISVFAQSQISSPIPVNIPGLTACNASTFQTISAASSVVVVPLPISGQITFVCGFLIMGSGGGNGTFKFESSTNNSCTGTVTQLSPAFPYTSNTPPISFGTGLAPLFNAGINKALCIVTSSTTVLYVLISYVTF